MRWASLWCVVAGVLLLLALIEIGVRTVFLPRYIRSRYSTQTSLRAWAGGDNLSMLMRALAQRPSKKFVAMIGDSTMNTLDPNEVELPYFTQQELTGRHPDEQFEVIHGGIMGLYATEAALMADRYIGSGVHTIVWGVQSRAFPIAAPRANVTHIRWQMAADDLWRLYRSGMGDWWLSISTPEQTLSGLVAGSWSTFDVRRQLREILWERLRMRLPQTWAASIDKRIFADGVASTGPRQNPLRRYRINWEDFGPNPHWGSIEAVAALCGDFLDSRCVLYAGPINPAVHDDYVEPRVQEYFLEQLRQAAQRHGVVVADLSDALTPDEFREPMFPGQRFDPIHPNQAGRRKLAQLLVEPILRAERGAGLNR